MIVVDSSVWIDYFNGAPSAAAARLDGVLGKKRLLTGDLIIVEVLQGFRSDKEHAAARLVLERLPFESMVGKDIAIAAAANYRALRKKGVAPRKTIDVLIATFCIENGHALLHADRDFDAIEKHLGLKTL